MKIFKPSLYLFLLFNIYTSSYAQNSVDSSYKNALSFYKISAGVNAHLYNGSEYIDYDHRITGNPFFASSYFADGDIEYDGVLYTGIKMFYDILHDDVVIKNYNDTALLLVKEKVSAFNFANHYFINLTTDSSKSDIKISGFYDVIYNGNVKLFAKRKKEITEKISTQYSESFFTEKDDYYILKNTVLYGVNDEKSVLHVLKEKKSDIGKFMKKNKIKFRRSPETAMIKMVAFYDGLNTAK